MEFIYKILSNEIIEALGWTLIHSLWQGALVAILLGVSLDNNNEKWRNMLIDKELKGIQIRATEGWKSQFAKDYKIRGIPALILIDREQNFIDARALLPSENVSEVLYKLEGI